MTSENGGFYMMTLAGPVEEPHELWKLCHHTSSIEFGLLLRKFLLS